MKCEKLDWQIGVFGANRLTVAVSCTDFEQSLRFVELLKTFILTEKPRPILDDVAWYCPPALQQTPGSMT